MRWLTVLTTFSLAAIPLPLAASEVSFRNDVMAVLSKAGCNQGTCHGNANGKGGLKLSLRGDDPEHDLSVLTRAAMGRRISVTQPERSLILLKPTMQLAHEGGRRFTPDSQEYRILRDWIAAGAQPDRGDLPRAVEIVATPSDAVLVEPHWEQHLRVTARFSDGTERDVTSLAVFEPSLPIVTITGDGRVKSAQTGEVTIGVRYVGQQVAVRLAFIPDVPDSDWNAPPQANAIDRFVFAKLKQLRIPAAPLCDDVTFLRRAYLDVLGVLPTADQARAFLESTDSDKRTRLVDALLARPEFAEFWALKWADLLRVEEKTLDRKGVENFYHWLRHQFALNRPLDAMCREIIAARGSTYAAPAANYYRAMRDPITRAESTAQLMLGVRLQCAKCHNHPFDRWTQDDYYGWANLFARVDYKILENNRRDRNDKHEFVGEQIVYITDTGNVQDPRTGQPVPPLMLDASSPLGEEADPLLALAEWATAPENPFFARAQVNRIWYHLMGRGIVDPIDDFRLTNSPSHPELLDWLTEDFVRHQFDVRHVIRQIMTSSTYQLSSETNPRNEGDETNFSHALVRRLPAEQILDAIMQVTGVPVRFNGYPEGIRAGEIPGVQAVRPRDRRPAEGDQFLVVFGKPARLQACECERAEGTTLAQTFQLISGPLVDEVLSRQENVLGRLLARSLSTDEIVTQLYWAALSRPPSEEELKLARQMCGDPPRRALLEDLLWGLLNSNEFLLRR